MRRLRLKFLFLGGLLLSVAFVALESFDIASATLGHYGAGDAVKTQSAEDSAKPSQYAGPTSESLVELKKENEVLEKTVDELMHRYIALKRKVDLVERESVNATASGETQESIALKKLAQERDEYRRKFELAEVKIEQLESDKQGKLRLSDELTVVNSRAKNLQQESARLEAERSKLQLELGNTRSELQSTTTKNKSLLSELEALRSQLRADTERYTGEQTRIQKESSQLSLANQKFKQEVAALQGQVASLESRGKQSDTELQRLKTANEDLNRALIAAKDTETKLSQQVSMLTAERAEKEQLAADYAAVKKSLQIEKDNNSALSAQVQSFQAKTESQAAELQTAQVNAKNVADAVDRCEAQLGESRAKLVNVTELERQVVKLQNELLIKQTELDILSAKDQPVAATSEQQPRVARSPSQELASGSTALRNPQIVSPSSAPREMIVEATAGKTQLRSGPGTEHGVLMHVKAGTRLVVEDRQGDWFRVLTPTGTRAYISSDVARPVSGNPTAVQTGGRTTAKQPFRAYSNSDSESAALEHLRQGVGGQ